jgi:hypothetical protein
VHIDFTASPLTGGSEKTYKLHGLSRVEERPLKQIGIDAFKPTIATILFSTSPINFGNILNNAYHSCVS